MTALPTGTVTFLFTDVEGSTGLLKKLGAGYGDVLAAHQRILRETFAAANGQEIDTQGDSFFVAFSRAKDALAAAVEGQRALAAHSWPDGAELRVRMGLHTGEPIVGSDRYVGLGVHRGARIMAAGHGGQVLLSHATRELVEDDLDAGITLRDLGEYLLKDLDRPEHLFQVVGEGLAAEFPPLRTQDAPTAYSGHEDALATAARVAIVRSRLRSRRALVGGTVIFLAVVGAGAFAAFRGGGSESAGQRPEANSAVAIDAGTGKRVDSVPVGSGPVRVASGAGGLWVVNGNAGTVSRIDPMARAAVQTIAVGDGPAAVAVGDGSVWVTNASDGTLSRISPEANREVKRISVPPSPQGVAFGEGAVWVASLDDRSIARVNPSTNKVDKTIPTGGTPNGVAVGAGFVWVTSESGSNVFQINPRTNSVDRTINVGNGPGAIAVGFGAVWVANTLDGTVDRIDPTTGIVTGVVSVGQGPRDVAIGNRLVWVTNEFSGTVSRIDPRSNRVVSSTDVGSRPTGVAIDRDLGVGDSPPRRGQPPGWNAQSRDSGCRD